MPETFVHKFDTPVFKGEVSVPLGLYIDGKWVDGANKTTIEYVLLPTCPSTDPRSRRASLSSCLRLCAPCVPHPPGVAIARAGGCISLALLSPPGENERGVA